MKTYDMQNCLHGPREFERYAAHAQSPREIYINLLTTIDSNVSIVCLDEFGCRWNQSQEDVQRAFYKLHAKWVPAVLYI